MHKGMGEYIGNPEPAYRPSSFTDWDSVKLDTTAGHYMICDRYGNGIKWIDAKDGMMIKIRAKFAHWPGYEYFHSDFSGKYSKYDANHKVYA